MCTALISVFFEEEFQNNAFFCFFSFPTLTQTEVRNYVFRSTTANTEGKVWPEKTRSFYIFLRCNTFYIKPTICTNKYMYIILRRHTIL